MTLIGRLEGGSAIAGQRENKSICLFFLSNPQLRVKMLFKLHFKRSETKESPKNDLTASEAPAAGVSRSFSLSHTQVLLVSCEGCMQIKCVSAVGL